MHPLQVRAAMRPRTNKTNGLAADLAKIQKINQWSGTARYAGAPLSS